MKTTHTVAVHNNNSDILAVPFGSCIIKQIKHTFAVLDTNTQLAVCSFIGMETKHTVAVHNNKSHIFSNPFREFYKNTTCTNICSA